MACELRLRQPLLFERTADAQSRGVQSPYGEDDATHQGQDPLGSESPGGAVAGVRKERKGPSQRFCEGVTRY